MSQDLLDSLPAPWRLAVAYAPVATRERWLTMLALDVRLAGVVRGAREPILAQMRLAWWRDRLRDSADKWPRGEPLLAALSCWDGGHGALMGLVDGWEALLGEAPLPVEAFETWIDGRVAACAALGEGADSMARGWALGDLAAHLGDAQEQAAVADLIKAHGWRAVRLPRKMRPLVVLHGLAARTKGRQGVENISLFTLLRLGMLGI
ncbi:MULTISPECIES: hypothetical protein [unclassified Novosphingobium]|uniref:hypothetical protein n=1 Tax=unclassified Novosphingobium TaxID=2644732 RepID=UPI000868E104|nr:MULTISPECIES: hypothetical protein [unclassified Novosphingobium]MBN9143895.1 hypothetical protein [Novosphingobium sp.]MDR6707080.1 phytoene synthase [Novosphingobium sp. 1748]ODU84475.1 MAG: hypothetical protein ABT10_03705 [Novosphingobium sp. SCN 63-17]OJX93014.1 MAG: hypothetical protein BGP00_24295 [Novosphingobium sp. 63-713]